MVLLRAPHWVKWITMRHLTLDCSHTYFSFRVLLKNDLPSWCHSHFPRGQDDCSLFVVSSLSSCLCVHQASSGWWVLTDSLPLPLDPEALRASPMPHGVEHTLALSGHFWVHSCPWKPLGALEDIIKWTLIDNKQLPPLSAWCGLCPRFVASTVLLCYSSKVPWIFMLSSLRKTCPEQFFYAIK